MSTQSVAVGGRRGRVARGDRGLDLIRAGLLAPERGVEPVDTVGDPVLVPAGAVLLVERDEVTVLVDAPVRAGRRAATSTRGDRAPPARRA